MSFTLFTGLLHEIKRHVCVEWKSILLARLAMQG